MSLTVLVLQAPAHAGTQVPLKGAVHAQVVNAVGPDQNGVVALSLSIWGHATHLGRLTGSGLLYQNLNTGSVTGQVEWFSPNGKDSIRLSIHTFASSPTADPCVVATDFVAVIIGGTGRFVHATGAVEMGGTVNQCTGEAFHPFAGTISRPNSH